MATLAELDALIDSSAEAANAARAIAGGYEILLDGVPTIDGFVFLINNALNTNFGSGNPSIVFNQENIYINTINALVQGNPTAAASFNAIVAGNASMSDMLNDIYTTYVPIADQTDEGRAFFTRQEAVDFYTAVAAERGVAGTEGAAIVALASLLNILVNQDIGIGDSVNDLLAAIDDGSAALPTNGDVFTPIEDADGTNFDGDDTPPNTGEIFTLTTDTGENVIGTTGNDLYQAVIGGPNATFQTFDRIADQGGDADSLSLVVRGAGAIPAGSSISGVEIINIDQSTADFNPAPWGGDTTFSGAFFQGATQIWQEENFQHITGLTAGQTAGFRDLVNGAGEVLNHWAQWVDGVSEGSVALAGVDSGSAIGFLGNGLTTASVSGSVDSAGGGAPGQLTINIQSGTLIPVATDTDVDTDITTLNLALTNNTVITVVGVDAVDLETVDASASTGGIITDISGTPGPDVLALTSVSGGSGNDNFTIDLDDLSAATLTVAGNAGNDLLTFNDSGASLSAIAVSVTGGDGNDTIDPASLTNIKTASSGGITAGLVTVTDFNPTDDVLDLSTNGYTYQQLSNTELGNVEGQASLLAAVNAAAALLVLGTETVFDWGGSMYYLADNNADGALSVNDGLIQLVGMNTDLLDASNFITV